MAWSQVTASDFCCLSPNRAPARSPGMHNVPPDTITITERVTEELRSRTADVRASATELHWLGHHSATDSALLRALRRSRIEEEDVAVENITKAGHGSWVVFLGALAAGSFVVLGHQLVAPAGLF